MIPSPDATGSKLRRIMERHWRREPIADPLHPAGWQVDGSRLIKAFHVRLDADADDVDYP
jgi:hypothetical protein